MEKEDLRYNFTHLTDFPYGLDLTTNISYNWALTTDLTYNGYSPPDTGVDQELIWQAVSILTICGLILNVILLLPLFISLRSSFRSADRTLTSRIFMLFGIIVTHTLEVILSIWYGVLFDWYIITTNKIICIFTVCIVGCLECVAVITGTLLSVNLLNAVKRPHAMSSRKSIILWISAGIAAWIVGFGVVLAFVAPFVKFDSDHCSKEQPVHVSLIQSVFIFLIPYIGSFTAIGFTLKFWHTFRGRNIAAVDFNDDKTKVSVKMTPSGSDTLAPDLSTDVNLDNKDIKRKNKKEDASDNDQDCSDYDKNNTEDMDKQIDLNKRKRKSLRLWIVFNGITVLFGFLSRLLYHLPRENLLNGSNTNALLYAVNNLIYYSYIACFPLLCLIISEVRLAFKTRICKVCYKATCFICECLTENDEENE